MKNLLADGGTIVFDGDSLTNRRVPPTLDTWPLLRLMNWEQTWADELSRLLFCWHPELNLTFHNAAVGGSNCHDVLKRLDTFVLPHTPIVIMMTIGSNDHAQRVPLDDFHHAMTQYVQRARAECAGRVLFLGGFHRMRPGDSPHPAQHEYDEALQEIARDNGGFFLDAGAGLMRKSEALLKQSEHHVIASDGSHLNAVGSLVVAGEVYRFLGL